MATGNEHKNVVKFGCMVFESCVQTNRQIDKQADITHHNTNKQQLQLLYALSTNMAAVFLQYPRSILVTSSRGCRACRRGCHEDATRKLLPWNLSSGSGMGDRLSQRSVRLSVCPSVPCFVPPTFKRCVLQLSLLQNELCFPRPFRAPGDGSAPLDTVSGVETGRSGVSMNRGPELLGTPSPGPKNLRKK